MSQQTNQPRRYELRYASAAVARQHDALVPFSQRRLRERSRAFRPSGTLVHLLAEVMQLMPHSVPSKQNSTRDAIKRQSTQEMLSVDHKEGHGDLGLTLGTQSLPKDWGFRDSRFECHGW